MSKRTATEVIQSTTKAPGQAYPKASGSGSKRDGIQPDEMGEYEDPWEDEIQSDEDVVDRGTEEDGDGEYVCPL